MRRVRPGLAAERHRRRRLTHFTCVDGTGAILVPCGRCRQLLYEFGGPELVLETPDGLRTLDQMLPQATGPDHLK